MIFLNIPRNIILVNLGKVGSYSDIASSGSIIRFFFPIYPVAGKLATGYGYINIWIYLITTTFPPKKPNFEKIALLKKGLD